MFRIITIKVHTGSSQEKILPASTPCAAVHSCSTVALVDFIVYVRERPHDNLANQKLLQLIAKHFNIPKTQVAIVKGHKSKIKTIRLG